MEKRPVLKLRPTADEARSFNLAYEKAEIDGDHGRRASLGDMLFVRQQLVAQLPTIASAELVDFVTRADRIIELAYWGGIAVALGYLDRSDRDIDEMLARMQEWYT